MELEQFVHELRISEKNFGEKKRNHKSKFIFIKLHYISISAIVAIESAYKSIKIKIITQKQRTHLSFSFLFFRKGEGLNQRTRMSQTHFMLQTWSMSIDRRLKQYIFSTTNMIGYI